MFKTQTQKRLDALEAIVSRTLTDVREYNAHLNDPHGDDSGNDAKAPDGNDYNAILDLLRPLYAAIQQEAV